jgi:hypothetical protein
MFRTTSRWSILAIVITAGLASSARSGEVATIRNESNHVVSFYLRWTDLPYDSHLIRLAPGEFWRTDGPDGSALFIRFDSMPGTVPVREMRHRVATRFGNFPGDRGMISVFRSVSPFAVDLCIP